MQLGGGTLYIGYRSSGSKLVCRADFGNSIGRFSALVGATGESLGSRGVADRSG